MAPSKSEIKKPFLRLFDKTNGSNACTFIISKDSDKHVSVNTTLGISNAGKNLISRSVYKIFAIMQNTRLVRQM